MRLQWAIPELPFACVKTSFRAKPFIRKYAPAVHRFLNANPSHFNKKGFPRGLVLKEVQGNS